MQIRRHHDVGPSWPRLSTDQDDCKFVVKDHPITVFAHCFQIRTTVFDEKTFYRFLLFICEIWWPCVSHRSNDLNNLGLWSPKDYLCQISFIRQVKLKLAWPFIPKFPNICFI